MAGEKLSRKQEQAIAALLMAPTIAEAANETGIGERTLFRWLQRDDFRRAYRLARQEAMRQAIARLQQAARDAVDTLSAVMRDDTVPATNRVAASRAVLEFALKGAELEDLEARVADLETVI